MQELILWNVDRSSAKAHCVVWTCASRPDPAAAANISYNHEHERVGTGRRLCKKLQYTLIIIFRTFEDHLVWRVVVPGHITVDKPRTEQSKDPGAIEELGRRQEDYRTHSFTPTLIVLCTSCEVPRVRMRVVWRGVAWEVPVRAPSGCATACKTYIWVATTTDLCTEIQYELIKFIERTRMPLNILYSGVGAVYVG